MGLRLCCQINALYYCMNCNEEHCDSCVKYSSVLESTKILEREGREATRPESYPACLACGRKSIWNKIQTLEYRI